MATGSVVEGAQTFNCTLKKENSVRTRLIVSYPRPMACTKCTIVWIRGIDHLMINALSNLQTLQIHQGAGCAVDSVQRA